MCSNAAPKWRFWPRSFVWSRPPSPNTYTVRAVPAADSRGGKGLWQSRPGCGSRSRPARWRRGKIRRRGMPTCFLAGAEYMMTDFVQRDFPGLVDPRASAPENLRSRRRSWSGRGNPKGIEA